MLPTPSTSHVDYDRVYEPAEDSYLLLDALSSDSEKSFLRSRFPTANDSTLLLLEVGSGSGVVVSFATAHAKEIFGRVDVAALGTDLNPFACRATAQTAQTACREASAGVDSRAGPATSGSYLSSILADLTSPLRSCSIDVLIFNPPYVPTEALPGQDTRSYQECETAQGLSSTAKFERDSHLLALSYAGGLDGMETTDRLLAQLPDVLSTRGIAYILLCAQNQPDGVIARIRSWGAQWSAEVMADSGKKAGWEKLCVLRIWRP